MQKSILVCTLFMCSAFAFCWAMSWDNIVCNPSQFLNLYPCAEDDGDEGFCSFCAFKEHIEKSIRGSGSILWPNKFKDNLSSILSFIINCRTCL